MRNYHKIEQAWFFVTLTQRAAGILLFLLYLGFFTRKTVQEHVGYDKATRSWLFDLISLTRSNQPEIHDNRVPYKRNIIPDGQIQQFHMRGYVHPSPQVNRKTVRETPSEIEMNPPESQYRAFYSGRTNPHMGSRNQFKSKPAPNPDRTSLMAQEIAICHALTGLTQLQRQICLRHSGLVWAMLEGTQLGLHECVHQFKHEQWNCSAVNLLFQIDGESVNMPTVSGLEGILQRGSRETAFLSSAWSAGVVQAITRACSRGQMGTCDCDPHRREGQDRDAEGLFTWGGCSDPIKFGMRLTRLFLDASDQENRKSAINRESELHGPRAANRPMINRRRPSRQLYPQPTAYLSRYPRSSYEMKNNESKNLQLQALKYQRKIPQNHGLSPQQLQAETLLIMLTKARTLMNLHNRKAGRRLVWKNRIRKCKCHGVSGACSMRTCWQRLNEFRQVGSFLKIAYNEAIRVTYDPMEDMLKAIPTRPNLDRYYTPDINRPHVNRYVRPTGYGSFTDRRASHNPTMVDRWRRRRWPRNTVESKRIQRNKLVYLEESPNYCRYDPTIGHLGIAGRLCNATHPDEPNSCNRLCCDQGFDTLEFDIERKCECKFFWCCEVRCKTCRERTIEHRCKHIG